MLNITDLPPPILEKSRREKTPKSPIKWVAELPPPAPPTGCAQNEKKPDPFVNPNGGFKMAKPKKIRQLTGIQVLSEPYS